MEQLKRQIELVTNCFQYIHNHEGDLDLQLTVTVSSTPAQQDNKAPAVQQQQQVANPLTTSEEKPM